MKAEHLALDRRWLQAIAQFARGLGEFFKACGILDSHDGKRGAHFERKEAQGNVAPSAMWRFS
jgi:hypothetical protein